jgi:hypothetical protein
VRGLRAAPGSEDVRRLAAALVEKWRGEVLQADKRRRRVERQARLWQPRAAG